MRQLFHEPKRLKVYRVAVTYAVVAFVIWQVVEHLFPTLGVPIALVLAWTFEVTPGDVRRTPVLATPEEGPEPAEERRFQLLGGYLLG